MFSVGFARIYLIGACAQSLENVIRLSHLFNVEFCWVLILDLFCFLLKFNDVSAALKLSKIC